MFDITSWIRETIFRRPKLTPSIAGEELSEKQTTKLGYFLLFCMFVAIMSTAQWTLSIISGIPERPTPVPSCVSEMLRAFDTESTSYNYSSYNYGYDYAGYNSCTLTSVHPKYDLSSEFKTLEWPLSQLNEYFTTLSRLESEKSQATYRQQNNREDYNTSLSESAVQEQNPIYDANGIRQDITTTRSNIANADLQITNTKHAIESLRTQYAPQVSDLKYAYEWAESAYIRANLLYRMFIALLSLAFSGLVFAVLYRMYVRRKLENSPHTIIFSVATFAYGLVLLQVLLMFLWDIIPHTFLEWLLGWISLFAPLLYLVQFLWPVVIVAIFGFLVYRIQKRLYSPQNIVKRFVTDKKCPHCGNAVDMTKPFCPLCAHEIHIHCPHCHELTMKGMPYCSNCGGTLPKDDTLYHSDAHTITRELEQNLENISLDGITWVTFSLLDGTSFISKRETIIRLALSLTKDLGKSVFAPKEFAPYLERILSQVDKKGIREAELARILGKIQTWVEVGWSVTINKK